jgi:hypothetical protein
VYLLILDIFIQQYLHNWKKIIDPLVMTNIAMEAMALIEIDDFPSV